DDLSQALLLPSNASTDHQTLWNLLSIVNSKMIPSLYTPQSRGGDGTSPECHGGIRTRIGRSDVTV
ncbi:hypothetical protein ACUOI0_23570, partial [Escherichia coli]